MQGNRKSKDDGTVTMYYRYDLSNRMTLSGNGYSSDLYEYDKNGNLLYSAGSHQKTYTYDKLNRLKTAYVNNVSSSYKYDGTGLRTSKTVGGVKTDFILDNGSVVGTITGDKTTEYFRGMDLIWLKSGEDYPNFFYSNLHGDITAIRTKNNADVASYSYDAFGNITSSENEGASPFRYCGEYMDEETGLIYLRNRYYDPETGAFISEDPARDGLNWYVYCYNDPVKFVDLGGLNPRPYEPGKWNNDDVQMRTNCYAYAMDWCGYVEYGQHEGQQLYDGSNEDKIKAGETKYTGFAAQPGFLNSDSNTLLYGIYKGNENNHRISALAGALLDATSNGHTFRLATEENIKGNDLGENEWVVYLVANSEGTDYHWYRQNAGADGKFDGTWSHKPGNTPATNRELLEVHRRNGTTTYKYGDVITDPTAISRTTTTYRYYPDGTTVDWEETSSNTYDVVIGAYVVGY